MANGPADMTTPALAAPHVLARIRAAADSRALVDLYGSVIYAPAYASDVDVLVSHDDAARLATVLGLELIPTRMPRLHGVLEGVEVDITVVNGDDDLARRMRAGPRDAAQLAIFLRDRDDVFQATWPHVRQFVRARALGHNGLGWFGSFGWALLLAVPLVRDRELRAATPGAALPVWLRWLSRLAIGSRVDLDGLHAGYPAPFFLAAPSPPLRDVAQLTKRAAMWLFAEARESALAIRDAVTDADALARIGDIADAPPAGTTLVISGDDEQSRGRYEGNARGLVRDLEALGAARSWGRFDVADDVWQHRITVPTARRDASYELVEHWLATAHIDATVES
jgi:hypothetical protein